MAYSYVVYTGNGSTTQFAITFPYIRKEHVKVYVNYVDTAYTYVNDTTVQLAAAPASPLRVEVRRVTPLSTRLVDYTDGSTLVAADLDTSNLQSLYNEQELDDNQKRGLFVDDATGLITAGGQRITNVANPVNAQDAATKTYVDTADALKVAKAGDTMSGALAMGTNKITNLGTPTVSTDAVTKAYIDGYINTTYLGPLASDPATRPGGAPLQIGDQYFNTTQNIVKAWTGTVWVISAAAGNIIRWRKTAFAGNTTLSGTDDLSVTLSYVVGNEQVYLNGALQTRGVDYTAATGTSITLTPALLAGDVVELHAVQGYVSATITPGSINDALVAPAAGIQATKLSFTQAGTGATARTIDSKLKEVVSVKDFGAVGDGVANDTAAILAAINSNASFLEVYIPPGTYRLSSPLIINRQNLTLTGAGRATTLYPDAGVTAIELAQGNGVSLTVLRDFRIYGNTNATGGIALGGFFVAFCQIHNLSIENFTSMGSFGVKMSKVQELDIFNCYIADNYNNVIFPNVAGNYATSVHIHGEAGYIGRALNLGILLEKEAASLVVSDIVIENNDAGGIAITGKGSQVNISRVHFEANTGPNSIYVSGTAAGRAKFTVSECFFFDEPAPILRTDYVIDSVVENNLGLVGAGKIITTANSTIQFRFNRGEDVALDPDAITLYESLLGKITYTEAEITTGAIVNKVNQIRFPATPVLSSNSSTLDDYKEGTWTPSLTCGTSGTITLSSANARYTKIGNMVTVFAVVVVSGVSSPVGELRLNGLPFAIGAYGGGTFAPFAYGLAVTAITSLVGVANSTTSYAVISKYATGGVANLAQDVQNGTGIYVSFSYLI